MKVEKLKELVFEVANCEENNKNGGVGGLYILFSMWREDSTWSFVQSYITKEGVHHMTRTISQELLDRQYLKLTYVNGNTDEVNILLNTKEYYYMESEDEKES